MSGARVLLIDDDPAVLRGVSGLLRDEGYETITVSDCASADALLASAPTPDLMLLDLAMPTEGGLAYLARLPRPLPLPIVVLSGEASPSDAVAALRLGASDFVEKPPSPERLLASIANVLAYARLEQERQELRRALAQPGHLVGTSAAMEQLRVLIARVAPSDAVILIQGETGAGKERVARALHAASGRNGRFVAINCAAIPPTLLESELFGHEKGAFTGATARHLGRFEQADGGTLLLDEIGDMPLELQAKLLRVLETREVERLGGGKPIRIDARVLGATHRDLQQAVREGKFRQDLYFRLAVFPLRVPPLRERASDLVPLVRAFAADIGGNDTAVTVTAEGEATLARHPWPGNVRELRNFVERLVLLRGRGPLLIDAAATAVLSFGDPLGPATATPTDPTSDANETSDEGAPAGLGDKDYRSLVDEFERTLLRAALERAAGNVAAAARLLRTDRGNLYRRMQALGLVGNGEPGIGRPPT
ncbi:MAG TPA: sigma-54 dependent transcriptional regulator [Polyangia bacterium]